MRAVMCAVVPDVLAWRKETGADRYDEMWEGVLHMPPMPNRDHQDLEGAAEAWLRRYWAPLYRARVFHQINLAAIGGWPKRDYRIPDLVLLKPDRFRIDHNEYFEGAPNVVVEIHSPDDESYEKLSFYARLGVPEVWIIDRDTRVPEVYLLRRGRYRKQKVGARGWIRSPETGVELRAGKSGKLAIRLAGDDSTLEALPPD